MTREDCEKEFDVSCWLAVCFSVGGAAILTQVKGMVDAMEEGADGYAATLKFYTDLKSKYLGPSRLVWTVFGVYQNSATKNNKNKGKP